MRAGRRRTRLRVDYPVKGRDANGAPTTTFVPLLQCFGEIAQTEARDLAGVEGVRANQTTSTITLGWTPQTARIDTTWRIVELGGSGLTPRTIFDIQSALQPDGRKIDLRFVCQSGVTRG